MKSKVELQDEVAHIRAMMENASRFTYLSGASSMVAGFTCLIALTAAYSLMQGRALPASPDWMERFFYYSDVIGIAAMALVACASVAGFLAWKRASLAGQSPLSPTGQRFLFSMLYPLALGGVVCAVLLVPAPQHIGAMLLLFYGLAALMASPYSLGILRNLGLWHTGLGVVALLTDWDWACLGLGFGALHLVYGFLLSQRTKARS